MRFRVGPFDYTVRRVEGYIRHEGVDCLGLCDNDRHELLISDRVGPAQQVQVICHEYMEAWLHHFGGEEMDKERYCDLFGVAMTQFVLDFVADMRPVLKDKAAAAVEALLGAGKDEGEAGGPFRVTRIYGPAEGGKEEDGAPWLMTLVGRDAL